MVERLAQDGVGVGVVGFYVMALNLFEDLVRLADLFIFEIEYGINEMFAFQGTEAVLPTKAGEYRAVVERRLAIKVELGGPPRLRAVFELDPESVSGVAIA